MTDSKRNPTGKYVRFGEYDEEAVIRIPGGIPEIVSEETFQKAQVKMKERCHKAAKFAAKQEYLLSGKIFCGECGSPYAGNSRKPRPDHPLYVSYKCTRRNQRNDKCTNPEINRDKLESIVLDKLSNVLFNPEVIPMLVSEYNEYIADKNGSAKKKTKLLKNQLAEVERKITKAVDLLIETSSSALKTKLRELEEQKEKIQYELSDAETVLKGDIYCEEEIVKLFHMAEKQLKNGALANRRIIIEQYVNKVLIYPDKIEVYMNLMNDYVIKETVSKK